MNKIKRLILITIVVFSAPVSSAVILTPLPSDTYITDSGLDWTWASKWSHLKTGVSGPALHDGWRYAMTSELDYIFENLVSAFLNSNSPIESTAYWNDPALGASLGVNIGDLTNGAIASGTTTMSYGYSQTSCGDSTPCEQFYVRGAVKSVPEPATLSLLGLGLVALSFSRRRKAE